MKSELSNLNRNGNIFSSFRGKMLRTLTTAAALFSAATMQGQTWTLLNNTEPNNNMGVMLLLTDGTVIAHNSAGGGSGTGWDKLTPDATGSYINGTWTTIASMNYDRMFFPTQVFPDGKVLAAGGEYGTGATHGEVYDPVANKWTNTNAVTGNQNIYDGNNENLLSGVVLVGVQNGNNPSYDDLFYTESTNSWTTAPIAPQNHDEAAWLKLPDNSILFVGIGTTNACRYIPSTNTWVTDASCPVMLYDSYGFEAGAAMMLPNGKAIFLGATGHNALYTPSGTSSPGTWSSAPDFPKIQGGQVGTVDAPAAMEPNGKLLCAVSPIGTSFSEFNSPTWFVEYSYTTNTFAQVTATLPGIGGDSIPINCDFTTMLVLPTGQILLGNNQTSASEYYWVYTEAGSPIPQAKPVLNSIYQKTCGTTYYMTGKMFNGLCEGAAFGDDWNMSTNYPLVRLTGGTGNVYYAKTTNWNRIGALQTDSLEDTAEFTLPAALPAGTYTLQVVVNGVPSSNWIFSTYGVTASVVSEITCNGANNGNAQATAQGGNPPYTYTWSNGSTSNPTGAVLSAGTYTVTVKDKLGCTTTASVTITQPAVLTASVSVTANVSCGGGANGSLSSTVSGGTTAYTYSWSGGGTSSTKTGLTAGSYTLTVTDKNGCTATASATITQPPTLSATATATANVSCNGGSNGSASVTASGGTPTYTYSWTGGGTSTSKTGLTAGSYTVTVTDKDGCTATASVTITQPAGMTLTTTVTSNVSCNGGSNGGASVTATGGAGSYTYAWTGGGTSSAKTGLTAGSYTVTVTDKDGCSATASATITQPTAISPSVTATTNVSCNGGANGSLSSSPTGGSSPYSYAWTGGGTSSTKTGLTAGSYTVTVTDKNGCTATASATITQPTALSVSATTTANVACNGGSSGSLSSTVSGGTAGYTYSWTGGGTSSTKTGLTAGSYTLTVTDKNGCTGTASATITQPTAVTNTTSVISNVSCGGGSNGSASTTAGGGTSPYSYAWTGGGTSSSKTGLTAGSYTVTVTDKNGCTATASVSITQPTAVTNSPSVTGNVGCNGGANGSASTAAGGGTGPYTYAWTGGGTSSSKTGLTAGSYTVTVTDKNGCTATASVSITQPTAVTNAPSVTSDVSCNGESNGSASTTAGGGTGPYTYAWTGGGANSSKSGLTAGSYTVTVTDNNGCSTTASVSVTQPTALSIVQGNISSVIGKCTGSAWVTVSGGTSPYTYSWSPGGGTTDTISNLCPGSYCCTVTDHNGCVDSVCTSVITGIQVIQGGASAVTIYPDPNNGYFTIAGVSKGQIVELYNYIGQQINTIIADDASIHVNIADKPNGVYLVRIITREGNLVTQAKILKVN